MIKVLFVCHGNICRSVAAEYMFKDMIQSNHLQDKFYCESKATSDEEIGNDIYGPMKPYLQKRNIPYTRHYARQINKNDYQNFDLILAMDYANERYLKQLFYLDTLKKVWLLNDYVGLRGEIADPWWNHDFDRALDEIKKALDLLLNKLINNK